MTRGLNLLETSISAQRDAYRDRIERCHRQLVRLADPDCPKAHLLRRMISLQSDLLGVLQKHETIAAESRL